MNMILIDEDIIEKPVTRQADKATMKRRKKRVKKLKRGHLMMNLSLEVQAEGADRAVLCSLDLAQAMSFVSTFDRERTSESSTKATRLEVHM